MELLLNIFYDRFLAPVDDPSSRLFSWNIGISLGLTLIYIVFLGTKRSDTFITLIKKYLFNRKYWWNASTKVDYKFYFFNGFLKVFLIFPLLEGSYYVSKYSLRFLYYIFKDSPGLELTSLIIIAFSMFVFIFDDFLRFIHHYLFHKVPFLWKCHQTHHSAKVLTPITLYRSHPVEMLASTFRNAISTGLCVALFGYLFESPYNVLNFMGVNLFAFTANLLGSHLRHSHIPLSFGFLEYVLVSPKQHQIHHENQSFLYDKNFGVTLSIWDQLMGSFIRGNATTRSGRFGCENTNPKSFISLLLLPFRATLENELAKK